MFDWFHVNESAFERIKEMGKAEKHDTLMDITHSLIDAINGPWILTRKRRELIKMELLTLSRFSSTLIDLIPEEKN